jgi:Fe-S cluster assembly ATP-binding protein
MPDTPILRIENLHAKVSDEDLAILKGLDLELPRGEVHAIMGPNGSGKSTLAKVLTGHPGYVVTKGQVTFDGRPLLELEPHERARAGMFLAFQYPVEIPGVSIANFLRTAMQSRLGEGEELDLFDFQDLLLDRMKLLEMDETDSGLDIDALKVVAQGVNTLRKEDPAMSVLMITHYQRLLDYIKPDVVHVMVDGRIVRSGGPEVALWLEEQGYASWRDADEKAVAGR